MSVKVCSLHVFVCLFVFFSFLQTWKYTYLYFSIFKLGVCLFCHLLFTDHSISDLFYFNVLHFSVLQLPFIILHIFFFFLLSCSLFIHLSMIFFTSLGLTITVLWHPCMLIPRAESFHGWSSLMLYLAHGYIFLHYLKLNPRYFECHIVESLGFSHLS